MTKWRTRIVGGTAIQKTESLTHIFNDGHAADARGGAPRCGISSGNDQAIDAAHTRARISVRWKTPRFAAGQLSDLSGEYRAYQTSAWPASALAASSLSFDHGKYEIWNSSWKAVDDKTLTNYITHDYKYSNGQTYQETTPHDPWPEKCGDTKTNKQM
ncbi:MAG TPA: hypothetical protein VE996_12715 [Terriglobales bacterium]|nr:hypothetical protein [Terriglobales bacterium]